MTDSSIAETGVNLAPDPELIRAGIKAVHAGLFEIRIPKVNDGNRLRWYGRAFNGVYNAADSESLDTAVRDISRVDGRTAPGVYFTINELDPVVLNYGFNRLARSERAVADSNVTALRYLFLDLDPVRPALTNATEAEHTAAMERLEHVRKHLHAEGWPLPVLTGSSGSGAMALYGVDLPPIEAGLIEDTLKALAALFNDDVVTVDTSVHNPARIVRIPGTVNAKSPTPQPDRPWTMATAKVVTHVG